VKLRVEYYSDGMADERPVLFHMGERACIVEEVLDQCTARVIRSSKCALTTAISTFCGSTDPRPKDHGAWSPSPAYAVASSTHGR
jgi:hypothetical protein